MKRKASILLFCILGITWTLIGQTVYIGPDQVPIQETNFGYSASYKVMRLGLNQNLRSLALNIDPTQIVGGQFTGVGQILIGNSGILAPNQAGTDWIGVLRATNDRVFLGGPMSSGDLLGGGITVMSNTGNVGVGTTYPEAKLHVQNYPSLGLLTDGLRVSRPNAATCYAFTSFGGGATGESGDTAFFGSVYAGGTKGRITFRVSDGASHLDAATIDPAGNVGIGTAYPRSRLDIGPELGAGKGARFGDYLEINEREYYNNASSIGWNAYIAANDGTYQPPYAPGSGMVLAMEGGGIGNLDFWGRNWSGSSTPVHLSAFTHVMRLSVNGNVGIGTTSPTEKLSVNGRIRAKEIIVETTGWSDYVFAKDYKLASLSDVEQHIEHQGHLPGVPSAKDVAANGVSVGDMQAILLAKIEELTLHQIAQEKRIAAQDTKIAAQNVEIAKLKAHNTQPSP